MEYLMAMYQSAVYWDRQTDLMAYFKKENYICAYCDTNDLMGSLNCS